jgi:hypothetical protein
VRDDQTEWRTTRQREIWPDRVKQSDRVKRVDKVRNGQTEWEMTRQSERWSDRVKRSDRVRDDQTEWRTTRQREIWPDRVKQSDRVKRVDKEKQPDRVRNGQTEWEMTRQSERWSDRVKRSDRVRDDQTEGETARQSEKWPDRVRSAQYEFSAKHMYQNLSVWVSVNVHEFVPNDCWNGINLTMHTDVDWFKFGCILLTLEPSYTWLRLRNLYTLKCHSSLHGILVCFVHSRTGWVSQYYQQAGLTRKTAIMFHASDG